ncbi:MAG: TraB/GumN family protein [Defluviitaleaceae bacterium]|nr:TraB/GumN family protein [Defluviitaleaceae bacterium]
MQKNRRLTLGLLLVLITLGLAACGRATENADTPYAPTPTYAPSTATPTTTPLEISPIPLPYPVDPAQDNRIHGALHRVEYGGNVAYIFGTLHGGRPYWFPLADAVEEALARADVIAVEIAEVGESAAAMEAAVMAVTFLPDGATWRDILPDEHYDHMVEMMTMHWGINYANVNTMNPSMLVTQLMMQIALMFADNFDVDFYATVDSYIAQIAAQRGLPIIGLESAQQQVEIMFNPPHEVMLAQIMQLQDPMDMINEFIDSGELTLDQIAHYYQQNDFTPILRSLALSVYDDCLYIFYTNAIVHNWRSTYYANEIKRLLRETEEPTTFFVAVGLSHVIRSQAHHSLTDIIQQLQLAGLNPVPLY